MDSTKKNRSKTDVQKDSSEETKRKFEYFSHQLDLAHKRNDLVDQLRFNIMQVFFGFQTFLIGAAVLNGGNISTIRNRLEGWEILLPMFSFLIGFSLYAIFFRYHIYLYGYKKWIENLENCLVEPVFFLEENKKLNGYTGTYSLAKDKVFNTPKAKLEGVVIFSLLLMAILNVGVTFLLSKLFEFTFDACLVFLLFGVIAHIVIVPLLLRYNSKIYSKNNSG